jgi:hypothetical protein
MTGAREITAGKLPTTSMRQTQQRLFGARRVVTARAAKRDAHTANPRAIEAAKLRIRNIEPQNRNAARGIRKRGERVHHTPIVRAVNAGRYQHIA